MYETPQEFSNRLALPFQDYRLLSRALTHRSYLNENPEALEDNERLEFLGDAVLDFLVGAWLYNHFPEMAEGELTRMRSALVRTEQLAEFAREINLGAAMRLGRGEQDGGGRDRMALLCGTFEALIGAIYLNAGIDAVSIFIEPYLRMAADQIVSTRRDRDPKSLFQEWIQAQGLGPPIYRILERLHTFVAQQADPRQIARSVVAAFRTPADDKGIELFLDMAADGPATVEIVPVRVRQILFNLVANAVSFTTYGGVRIRVSASPSERERRIKLVFSIADTGAGMSRSHLAIILGRGRTPDASESDASGLSAAVKLARLMGGEITAKSELGEGSLFTFALDAPVVAVGQSRSAA